jgi:hypothetical protein
VEGDVLAGLQCIQEIFDCLFIGKLSDNAEISGVLETKALRLSLLEERHGLLLAPASYKAWRCNLLFGFRIY